MDLLSPLSADTPLRSLTSSPIIPVTAPLRQSAEELASSFMLEMLKGAKLAEAFGGGNSAAEACNSQALGAIADQMTAQSPALADMIYQSLQRGERL